VYHRSDLVARTQEAEALRLRIREQTEAGKRLRREVFGDGRISIDRPLPFLVLYRRPSGGHDPGTAELATAGAAYLVATAERGAHKEVLALVDVVRELSMDQFGAFLLVEVWSRPPGHAPIGGRDDGPREPGFRLFASPEGAAADGALEVLAKQLRRIKSTGRVAQVEVPDQASAFPKRLRPLFKKGRTDLLQIGIEVEPSYRDFDAETVFPGVLRTLRAGLDSALRHTVFQFARRETKHRPKNFHALGRRAMVKSVWEVDKRLDKISSSFDFLLTATPTNLGPLWSEFRRSNYERLGAMRYRPLPIDPAQAKRELFAIPMERIEDPTMGALLDEKQEELDRQLTMLKDRGTERFLLGSLQLYGRISPATMRAAEELLERVPATTRSPVAGPSLAPEELARLAEDEVAYYRRQWEGVDSRVEIRPNIIAGMMVSRGNLYVASNSKTRRNRADALMQHEVGTHMVTHFNGKAQKFLQLKSGLAGYEELQEGLAVLAEYLVSGMTPTRLRTLAARVIAARAVLDGATFVDTFRLLCRYGFPARSAFQIALRVYRGGGFIKDCIYLRGLIALLAYLEQGEDLERLFVGKIALEHLPVIAELESRRVIQKPKLVPRYLEREDCQRRLAGLRLGKQLYELHDEAGT